MIWNLVVISLCLLLLMLLLWKEKERPIKIWLAGRMIASALGVISLACLALPINIHRQRSINAGEAIFLTEEYHDDSVIKFTSAGINVFTTTKSIKAFNATYIPDVSSLAEKYKAIHVFGNGLSESDVELLNNSPVIFHPAVVENSITSIGWSQQIISGEPLLVQGSFHNTSSSAKKIVLSGFDTNLDSTTIPAKQIAFFQLTTAPNHLDKAVYYIHVLSGKDTVENEPVPVLVKAPQPLSILLLAASPDFENKFIKNWLAQNEYKFAVRTTISQSKTDKQFVNISPLPLDRITTSLLDKFDLVIADGSELAKLPGRDIATLKNHVEGKGIGLIVKSDVVTKSSSFYANSFPLIETRDSIQHSIKLNLGDTSHSTSQLKIEQPLYIRYVSGTQPLVRDQHLRIVANSKMAGKGKVILTTIPNTFTWQLSGNNKDYSSYWSWLIHKAAKKIPLQEVWSVTPSVPQINEAVQVQLQTSIAGIPQAQSGEDFMHLEQHIYLPYQWNGMYWSASSGWQPFIANNGNFYWWYVYGKSDWKGIKALEKINATKKYAAAHPYKSGEEATFTTDSITEVPKIYFFLLFIICAGFLWFEKKYKDG